MEQDTKPFSGLVENLVTQISHAQKNADNHQKTAIQHAYKKWGVDRKPYFMNFGITDLEAERAYNQYQWAYDYYRPCDDDLSQHLIYFCLNKYLMHCQSHPDVYADIGCGNGGPTTMVVDKVNPKVAIGIDLVHQQIQQANTFYTKQQQLSFLQADAETLPLATNSVDLLTNFESSHLYPNPSLFFQEVARVLKPNGYFVYTDFIASIEHSSHIKKELIQNPSIFKLVHFEDITDKVCDSIYKRIVINERAFLQYVHRSINGDIKSMMDFAAPMSILFGALLLTKQQINELSPKFRNQLSRLSEQFQQHVDMSDKKYAFYLLKRIGNNHYE